MIHRCDRLRPTMRSAPFLGSLADLGAQSNHICGQHLSRANPRGPSLVTARPIHPTNRSDIVLVRCRSIIWHLTGHFTSISGQSAGIPCTRAIGSSIRRLTISLCSQRTWPWRVNCSGEFLPSRSTVVTVRIMRTLSVVLCANMPITHMILCSLHANLMRNKSESHSTDHPTLHVGCALSISIQEINKG